MCWFYMSIAQIVLDPPIPSVKQANVEKSAPNHPGKSLQPLPLTGNARMETTHSDMIFVQNFTKPDFQAKSFTPQKCVICDIFLA